MGHVYKARDTRLDRWVAVKVLQSEIADDSAARARFEHEARAISHINHPHICTLYDVGEDGGISYLVMELLEGETLAERLARGPLPFDQALTFAAQIADALDTTHRVGIVHGDIKPENVMLTKTGVKLLDFGLARQGLAPTGSADGVTTTTTITGPGTVVGTLQYLAPEQLEGKEADPRTDIFALGAVLYEMVSGHKAFDGHTPAAVIAAIMEHDPPSLATRRPSTPAALEHVVGTCLAKDPDARWQHAGDLARELAWVAGQTSTTVEPRGEPRRRVGIWMGAATALLIAAIGLALWGYRQTRPSDRFPIRTSILLPEGLRFTPGGTVGGVNRFALSPDGRRLAFAATDAAGNQMLWVRALDSTKATPVPDTDGALSPFWSPDSRTIAFVAQGQLKTVDPTGGSPVVIAPRAAGVTGAWSRDNVILFTPTFTSPLFRVTPSGGSPQQVTTLDKSTGDVLHRTPSFLPDARHFLYVAAGPRAGGTTGPRAVYIGSLDASEPSKLLIAEGTSARYADGSVVFIRENRLMAQPFDQRQLALTGDARVVAEQVELTAPGSAAFTLSDAGILAYSPSTDGSQLVWFDRSGRQLNTVGEPGAYDDVEISPDNHRAVVSAVDPNTNTRDLWIFDLDRGVRTRFTLDPAEDVAPIWSPDGGRIAFASNRKGHYDLYEKSATGIGGETLIYADSAEKYPTSWLPGTQRVLLWSFNVATLATGLAVLTPGPNAKPMSFIGSPASPGRMSPDGRWVAYYSGESGRNEVSVVSFPNASHRIQASTTGGTLPRWRRDGRELFYAGRDNRLMAVAVTASDNDLKLETPRPLFEARPVGSRSFYDVTGDGSRFLVNALRADSASPSITIVQNWTASLKP